MKKIFIVLLFTALFLSGCVSREEVFTDTMKKMDELTQLKMVITIDNIPVLGNVTGTLAIDNDKTESFILGGRSFTYTENNQTYYLQEFDDMYYRFEEEVTQQNYFEIAAYSNFLYDDFEYDGGYYISTKTINGMSDIYIKITDGYIDTMQFKINDGRSDLDIKLDFVNYGTATVTLPEFITLTQLEEALFQFTIAGFEYIENSTGYTIENDPIIIEHKLSEDFYTIIDENGSLQYYPETKTIFLDSNVSLDLSIYLSFENNPVLSQEGFEVIDKLYSLK